MEMWLEAGIKVIPVTPSVTLAKMAQKNGAFAVIAEGGESGGHVGDITTMALVPQICDAVDIPVIAAGGIGDGRGIAASFMLGAVGVQVGTRFLVADECTISPEYKKKVIKAKDIDTVVTGKRLGHPVRSIKNAFTGSIPSCVQKRRAYGQSRKRRRCIKRLCSCRSDCRYDKERTACKGDNRRNVHRG